MGTLFLDVDLDGYEDILVVNGQLTRFPNADMDQQIEAAEVQETNFYGDSKFGPALSQALNSQPAFSQSRRLDV